MSEPVPTLASPSLVGPRALDLGPIARRIAMVRAVIALVWAAALVAAIGDRIPTTASDVTTLAAVLLTAYPVIDVVSSLVEATSRTGRPAAVLRVNAAISAVAAIALAVATFAGDAGTTLVAFGAWAGVSGAIQLGVALHRRHGGDRQWPMIVSGGLSTVAGIAFVAASAQDAAHLANLAGYAALGALLYLVWAIRARTASGRR
ncbi:hypothetical protein [Conexibacter sp. CPCC 206217]|uniref:hypothetical protein n=1 Tax=Conexibacter sp. CPCC 206217 TaxID=3064574 RepID=UPI0027196BAF|nr:hypothetical protein [Conexibacter sp. CPCC 206217]MDO8209051.1 hypothetical protein [Conexibacter sp. CPCC 206217]